MTITLGEAYASGNASSGDDQTIVLTYFLTGENDLATVLSDFVIDAPATYGGLARQNVEVDYYAGNEDNITWIGRAVYKIAPITSFAVGDDIYSFDTGGGTEHVTHSISTSETAVPGGAVAADHKQAINVADGRVGGVDIVVPVFRWQETHYLADATVTNAYIAILYALTGTTNNAAFANRKGSAETYPIGSILFMGASGSKRDQGDWEITYSFAGGQNEVFIVIGDITVGSKLAWEYLWLESAPQKDATAKRMVMPPIQANVEQMYKASDFSTLGIR